MLGHFQVLIDKQMCNQLDHDARTVLSESFSWLI